MGTAVTSSRIQRDQRPRQTAVATCVSMGDGAVQEIAKRLPSGRLRDLDLSTLTKLLRKAELVVTTTSLLLRTPPLALVDRPRRHASGLQDAGRGIK